MYELKISSANFVKRIQMHFEYSPLQVNPFNFTFLIKANTFLIDREEIDIYCHIICNMKTNFISKIIQYPLP